MISIVTCMYNAQKYIKKYLESMEKQTSKDFEMIIIDDCSTDNSFELVNLLKNKYSYRISIFRTNKNSGPGIARNLGLEYVNGQNLIFVDIDDFILPETLAILKQYSEYDCVFFDYLKFGAQRGSGAEIYNENNGIIKKNKAIRDSLGAPWGKMFKMRIINSYKIRFPDLMRSEDIVFCKLFLLKANSFYYLKHPLYMYRITPSSIMHNSSHTGMDCAYRAMEELEEAFSKYQKEYSCIFAREIIYDGTNQLYKNKVPENIIIDFWSENEMKLKWKVILIPKAYTAFQRFVLVIAKTKAYLIGKLIINIRK